MFFIDPFQYPCCGGKIVLSLTHILCLMVVQKESKHNLMEPLILFTVLARSMAYCEVL